MAKRMKFSVVGLPHYTVWHLYEPSVDDIRHMEEMAQEQKNRENEEKERAERAKKIKEEFKEPNNQWEKDKNELQNMAEKESERAAESEKIVHIGAEEGPIQPGKEPADSNDRARKDTHEATRQLQDNGASIQTPPLKGKGGTEEAKQA